MENIAIKVELPISYGKQPITVYLPNAGYDNPGIAAFDEQYFNLTGVVSIKLSDPQRQIPGVVVSDYTGDIKVAYNPVDLWSATSKYYVDNALSVGLADKLNRIGASGETRVYAALANGNDTSFRLSNMNLSNTVPLRDSTGNFQVNNPSTAYHVVNLNYFNNELTRLNTSVNNRLAKASLYETIGDASSDQVGLMTPAQVNALAMLVQIVGPDYDSDNVVNTLNEVFNLLRSFSEEVDLANVLNSKVDAAYVEEYVREHGGSGSSVDTSNFLTFIDNEGGPGAFNVVYLNGTRQGLVKATPYMEGAETIVMRNQNNGITVPDVPTWSGDAASKRYVDSKALPTVTVTDNGAFLRVVSGVWTKSQVLSAMGVSF